MNSSQIKLRCLIIIANRGLGDPISNLVKDYAHFQSIILGRGTASSEIKAKLGISEPEKDIIYCFIGGYAPHGQASNWRNGAI